MAFKTIFKRYELKYLLTLEQKKKIQLAMEPYMDVDKYGRSVIRNLYFDTPNYRLIRHSIDRPPYKEKLRVRCYQKAEADSTVFVELKKKYDHVVYKRRVSLSEHEAMAWLNRKEHCGIDTQISREIDYFMNFYGDLQPTVFLSYEREAYFANDDSNFRITFDDTILCRREDLSLCSEVYGTLILPTDRVLMEIKCSGGIPLWLTRILSEERIYKIP